jgi:hypothetical protein
MIKLAERRLVNIGKEYLDHKSYKRSEILKRIRTDEKNKAHDRTP